LPSKSENRWEGLGLVYLEANFYERPVVGGNEGGVPEAILNEQTGLVVNSRDHIAVANAIIRLLSDPEFRIKLGKIGKKRVLHYFNSDRMARETISVLNCCKQRFSYKINLKNFFLFITRYIKTLVLRILTYFLGQK
jgi:glycosyltransferase involved in cell wall biosynthesis